MSWPTTTDGQYYIFDGQVLMPVDPQTGAPILMLRPQGGMGQGIPAVADGPPGQPATFSTTVNFTELAWDDPTTASMSLEELTPPTETTAGVYQITGSLHAGHPGVDGNTVLDPGDFDNPLPKKYPAINSAGTGFELVTPKVGDRHVPVSINNTTAGTANQTLAVVSLPSYDFDWRPVVEGQCVVTGTGTNVSVDLFARLNNETGGSIVGRCFGTGGTKERLVLSAAPPANSSATYDKVVAGETATIYLRVEKQSGSDSYTTNAATTSFCVRVQPVP